MLRLPPLVFSPFMRFLALCNGRVSVDALGLQYGQVALTWIGDGGAHLQQGLLRALSAHQDRSSACEFPP